MKTRKLQIVIFLLITQFASAQNSRLSQIWSAPLLVNPSLSGRFDGQIRGGSLFSWQKTLKASLPQQNYYIDMKFGKFMHTSDERQYIPMSGDTSQSKTSKSTQEGKDETSLKNINKGYWSAALNYYHYGDNTSPLKGNFYSATIARHMYFRRNKFFGAGFQAAYAEGDLDETRGIAYDKEISGGGFRYPQRVPGNRISKNNYLDFNIGVYYGMITEPVAFELGIAMYHLFYPKNDIFNVDSETKLRHRVNAHSLLRIKLNSKWGLVQRNIYWEEGLYYRSKSFNDSLHIIAFWTGVEFYKTQPRSMYNLNFGLYSRSFRTFLPYINLGLGKVVNIRYSYEFPVNSETYTAYSAKRNEISLILTYKRNTTIGTRFYKKFNHW